ncbi:MAG: HAMP domain-containing protein [Myxococcales bacterium]|nr:HAMP domain-containing protein [Myxococcales bacterium]
MLGRRLPFFVKLVLSHVLVAIVVVAIMAVVLHGALRRELLATTHAHSHAQARGTAQWVDRDRHPERLAPRLAAVMGSRVSILDADGVVLGDSEFPGEPSPTLANQANHPEVVAALASGSGRSVRRDENQVLTQYSVVQAGDGLYVRVGVPVAEAIAPLGGMRMQLLWAALLSAMFAIVLGLLAARLGARPLRAMRLAAERISAGDHDASFTDLATGSGRGEKAPIAPANDDISALQQSLTTMAAQLRTQISDLTAQRDQLTRMAQSARELVANVSHELRTPVTTIGGFAETLLNSDLDPATRREFTEIIARSSERMARLIADLLQLARLDNQGASALPLESVDLRDVVAAISPSARDGLASLPVHWHAEPPVVQANADALAQILENLLINARRHGAATSVSLATKATQSPNRVCLTITDNGIGIAATDLPRVTERFYCADPARSRQAGGAGLGLALVKQLVELQGGVLRVTSESGQGTAVSIELTT